MREVLEDINVSRGERGEYLYQIGPLCPSRENTNGHELRVFLQRTGLVAANTHRSTTGRHATFRGGGENSTTRVDFVLASHDLWLTSRAGGPSLVLKQCMEVGKGVSADWHDHLPVFLEVHVGMIQARTEPKPRLSRQKLKDFEDGRGGVHDAVERAIRECLDETMSESGGGGGEWVCACWQAVQQRLRDIFYVTGGGGAPTGRMKLNS